MTILACYLIQGLQRVTVDYQIYVHQQRAPPFRKRFVLAPASPEKKASRVARPPHM